MSAEKPVSLEAKLRAQVDVHEETCIRGLAWVLASRQRLDSIYTDQMRMDFESGEPL